MRDTLILIHGLGPKPAKKQLRQVWIEALEHAILRDFPGSASAFRRAKKVFIYYGDLANAICGVSRFDDMASRRTTLSDLLRYHRDEFSGSNYERLPGRSGRREFWADTLAGVLAASRLGTTLIGAFAPELRLYWERDSAFSDEVAYRTMRALRDAMRRKHRIAIISHSFGAILAYDALWELSHRQEYVVRYGNAKVDLWITLGAPLSNQLVRSRLRGGGLLDARRHLSNVVRWLNVAAEDDFIAHDERLADDFDDFYGRLNLHDKRIFNLALDNGRSDPHSDLGYLVHPVVCEALATWLDGARPVTTASDAAG